MATDDLANGYGVSLSQMATDDLANRFGISLSQMATDDLANRYGISHGYVPFVVVTIPPSFPLS